MLKAKLLTILSLAALAGCGGGQTGSKAGQSNGTFDSLAVDGLRLLNVANTTPATQSAEMPASGAASFTGVAAYSATLSDSADIVNDPDTLSQVRFDVDFADGDITGELFDFERADGVNVSGALDITDGRIADTSFTADVSGNLNNGGVDVTYTGSMIGVFGGEDADVMAGTGRAIGTAPGFERQVVDAVFLAEQ